MYQYETSPFSNLNPNIWSAIQNPAFQSYGYQGAPSQGYGQGYGGSGIGMGQSVSPYQNVPTGASPYQNVPTGVQSPFGVGAMNYLTPEVFAGALRAGSEQIRPAAVATADAIFITELTRCARGLQDISEQLEGRDPETQKKGLYAATANLFYVFGLLSSKGVFVQGDLPGKVRVEAGGPANATREFGKQLERFVDKATTGRGLIEELGSVVERGKVCFSEITRAIEGGETPDQQSRKKAA
jgi:hypothetical protein